MGADETDASALAAARPSCSGSTCSTAWARCSGWSLSSLKSRQDLFTWPPKLIFTPDFSGYQAVFGVGERQADRDGRWASPTRWSTACVISVSGTLLAVALGTLAGYACSRFDFRGRDDFMFFALSTRMIPPVAVLVFYHMMFARLGLTDTRAGPDHRHRPSSISGSRPGS